MAKKEIVYKEVNGCWECVSHYIAKDGYPLASLNGFQDKVHRHYYRIYKGAIPEGMIIRHTCDNRLCINPEHLILGTHADNVNDRVSRKRSAIGVKNGRSVLTEAQVLEIYCSKESNKTKLSKQYNVHRRTVLSIKKRETWQYLTEGR